MPRWSLADVIDLEAQLAWDRVQAHHQGGEAAGLDQRDRQIGERLGRERDDAALLHGWVAAVRERGDHLPGVRVVHVLGLLRAVGCILAAVVGVALAGVVLRYDGSRPVSVLAAAGILVILPCGLLALTLALQLPGLRRAFVLTGGPLQWLAAQLAGPWLRRVLPSGPPGYHAALGANLLRRDRGRPVYAGVGRAVVGELVQQWALVAMVAALAAVLLRVVFTDLAFAWGSTLQVDADWMRGWVDAFAAPWAWLWPAGVPSDELIAISRYNRLDDRFVGGGAGTRAADAAELGLWWRFLVATMVCWSLLPRAAAWVGFLAVRRRSLAAQGGRSAGLIDHRDQVERLRDAGPRFRSGPGDRAPLAPPPARADDAWPSTGPALVVVWDEACDETTARELVAHRGGPVAQVVAAGHGADAAVDAAAVAAVDAAEPGPIALVVDGAEQPLAEVRAFLRDLKHAGGTRALVVLLLGADAANRGRWQAAGDDHAATVVAWERPS